MIAAPQHDSKTKLLDAALQVIRKKGYAGTTVEDICNKAGVTKGSFFNHFDSKDDLALSATVHWDAMTEGLFAAAPYHKASDPLDRLIGYLKFRGAILTGELPDYTCLLGTLVQETHSTHPDIRAACDRGLSQQIADLTRDLEAAERRTLCTQSPMERRDCRLLYSIGSARVIRVCEGQAKPRSRARRALITCNVTCDISSIGHRDPKASNQKHPG